MLAQPRRGDQDEKPPRHILLAIALPRLCSLVPGLMNSVDGIGVPRNSHLHCTFFDCRDRSVLFLNHFSQLC